MVFIFKGDLQGGKSHNNGGQGYFKERFGTSLFKLPTENAFRVQTKEPDQFLLAPPPQSGANIWKNI